MPANRRVTSQRWAQKADVRNQWHSSSLCQRIELLHRAGPGISPRWAPCPPAQQHSHHVPHQLFPCHLQAGLGDCQVSRGQRCWKQPRGTLWACFAALGAPQFSQVSCHLTAPDHSPHLFHALTPSLSHFNSAVVQHKYVTVCTASKLVSSLPTHSAVTFTASETRQREWAFLAPNKSREL